MKEKLLKMPKKLLFMVLAVFTAALFVGLRPSFAQQEELDALKVCPDTQKLVLENAFLRVIEERLPPGGVQAKHRHPHGVTIAMSNFENDGFSYTDGHATKSVRTLGEVRWAEEVVHSGKNVSTGEQHIIRIELKY
jgi:hypothetical protein